MTGPRSDLPPTDLKRRLIGQWRSYGKDAGSNAHLSTTLRAMMLQEMKMLSYSAPKCIKMHIFQIKLRNFHGQCPKMQLAQVLMRLYPDPNPKPHHSEISGFVSVFRRLGGSK